MRALIVGGAGFIGSHLAERLVAEAQGVDVVDDLSSGSLANLAAARQLGGELTIHSMSVNAPEFAELIALREPDVIYHLALLPPGRVAAANAGAQVQGAVAVLESAAVGGSTKVIVVLPAGRLYGNVASREVPVKDGHAFDPVGLSGVLASTVVELLNLYRTHREVEFTVLAATSVYGDRQRPDGGVVAAFRDARRRGQPPQLHGDGRQSRDFLYIDDTVDALARAATRGGGLVINIGTGVLTPIRDLLQRIGGGLPIATVPGDADDIGRIAVSATRARIHLSWAPWTTLDEGLAALDTDS